MGTTISTPQPLIVQGIPVQPIVQPPVITCMRYEANSMHECLTISKFYNNESTISVSLDRKQFQDILKIPGSVIKIDTFMHQKLLHVLAYNGDWLFLYTWVKGANPIQLNLQVVDFQLRFNNGSLYVIAITQQFIYILNDQLKAESYIANMPNSVNGYCSKHKSVVTWWNNKIHILPEETTICTYNGRPDAIMCVAFGNDYVVAVVRQTSVNILWVKNNTTKRSVFDLQYPLIGMSYPERVGRSFTFRIWSHYAVHQCNVQDDKADFKDIKFFDADLVACDANGGIFWSKNNVIKDTLDVVVYTNLRF